MAGRGRTKNLGSKNATITFHPEILSDSQRRVLPKIGPLLTKWGFYLAGGTALALHLGHRKSVDLDWFSPKKIKDPVGLAHQFHEVGVPFVQDSTAEGTLYGTVSRVRLSLIEYPFAMLEPTVLWPEGGCNLAALPDIAAMKLAAVAQRGSKKDFVDLHELSQRSIHLRAMLDWYRQKYKTDEVAHLLMSLTYFDDANKQDMPTMLHAVRWPAIKKMLLEWVGTISGRGRHG
jgi:hypothetical protein